MAGNQGTGFAQGVAGFGMDSKATWAVFGNSFPGAAHEVFYDSSVENKPTTAPVPPLADPGACQGRPPIRSRFSVSSRRPPPTAQPMCAPQIF